MQLDGIGGDTCYGVAASRAEGAELLPIGLSGRAVMRRPVGIDRPVTLDDVELDEDAFLVRLHREMA
jgi:predicted homoserine dehydrogenase-like protein